MNSVVLLGKINSEPQIKIVGKYKVASFFLSVTGAGKFDSGKNTFTYGSFLIEAWGKSAEFVEAYLNKEDPIGLNGTLRSDRWVDTDGVVHERVKINAERFFWSPFTGPVSSDTDLEEETMDPFA